MPHTCLICKQPAGYRYRGQWNCKRHFDERRAMFADFEAKCQHQAKCLRPGMLPAECATCGFTTMKGKTE